MKKPATGNSILWLILAGPLILLLAIVVVLLLR